MRTSDPELRSRILAQLGEAPAPTRAQHRRSGGLALALSGLALGLVMGMHGLEGVRQRPATYVAVVLLGFGVVAVVLARQAVRALATPLPRDVGRLRGLALRAPWLWALAAALGTLAAPATWQLALVATPRAEGTCFAITLGCALVLVGSAGALYRGSMVRDAGPVALGVCASAGALAAFAISFACRVPGLAHVLLGHVLPVVLLSVLLAPLLGRVLRMPGPKPR